MPLFETGHCREEFDQFKRNRVDADVAWEANVIATNGDAGAIWIIFIWMHFTYQHGMAHFFPLMQQYVMIVKEKKGVSATDPLRRGGRTSIYALAETAQLVGIRRIPGGFIPRIVAKLAVFKKFASDWIKNQERQETEPIFQSQRFTEKCKGINLCREKFCRDPQKPMAPQLLGWLWQ